MDLSLPARAHVILELAASGLTDKAIAAELGLTSHTVDYHWRRIRTAMEVQSRTAAVAKFVSVRGESSGRQAHLMVLRSWPRK